MFRIWFERPLPPKYWDLLDGAAIVSSGANAAAEVPFSGLAEADAIIAAARMRYDGELMDQAPHLRVISRTGIGFDNISIEDATRRGIAVCCTPEGPTVSAAEHTLTLMLAVSKNLKRSERFLRAHPSVDFFNDNAGLELRGLQLGLIGLGRIGFYVGRLALALGMAPVAFDPIRDRAVAKRRAEELGIPVTETLLDLLSTSDIVSLHTPLTERTHHLMDAEQIAQMKPGAILINTARGGLVDESALLNALESGRIQGAGLDVFDPEPPNGDNPLLSRDDVVATPHVAGASIASKDRLWRIAITQALQVLRGERPTRLVNPEVSR